MEQLQQGAEQLNESRVLILGDKGAGKTCLARRLVNSNADMTTPEESTAGVDTTTWTLEKTNTKVRIWDFAGHTVTHAVHQFFLSERCLYILVCDGRTEQTERLTYWLDHMKNYGGDSQAVILINERDRHQVKIPVNKLKAKYAIADVVKLSIGDENQMETFGKQIAKMISSNPSWNKQEIPTRYYQVKAELEKLFSCCEDNKQNAKEHIDKSEFEAIANEHKVDKPEQLLTFLNDLGISLWYPKLANYNTLVLNPEWISHGIYQIINWVANQTEKQTVDTNDSAIYSISLEQFKQVFASDSDIKRFGPHHEFLFDLIKHYELAYESQSEHKQLIIPHLLPEDQPEEAKLPSFNIGESLMVKFEAKHPLPPHTISRFIVRHHKQIKSNDLVWREGVVLIDDSDKTTIALVQEDDRTISISAKGNNKDEFISNLRDTMKNIFESYKSDQPKRLYEVIPYGPQQQPVALAEPLFLSEKDIGNHVTREQDFFESQTGQFINLLKTAQSYGINFQLDNLIIGNNNQLAKDSATISNTTNTFKFQNCNFDMQGDLNRLTRELIKTDGNQAQVEQLQGASKALEEIENCDTPTEVKKSGVGAQVKELLEEMGDKNSSLYKKIEGTKNGIGIAQDLAAKYNSLAEWAMLPQIPKVFLKG